MRERAPPVALDSRSYWDRTMPSRGRFEELPGYDLRTAYAKRGLRNWSLKAPPSR